MNIFLGVLLVLLGLGTFWVQVFTTLASVYFLGWILIMGGIAELIYGIFSGSWRKFFLYILAGALSIVIGVVAITSPAFSAATFTLLIATVLMVSGLFRIGGSLINRSANWGWTLMGGIVSLLLSFWIFATWPFSGLYVIGLFIGVELIMNGIFLMATPSTSYEYEEEEEKEYESSPYLRGAKGGKSKKKDKK